MKEYFGNGCLRELTHILKQHAPKKVFLVTGKKSYVASGAQQKIEQVLGSTQYVRFSDFEVNPKLEHIKRGIHLFKQEQCDFVIAIGGGSVMDTAKAINILAAHDGEPEAYIRKTASIENKAWPLVAIPTTSGSGSEATHFAVVYINKEKFSLAHQLVLPTYSFVDPTLTYSVPKKMTAVCGMDAFIQAVESFWSVGSTQESQEYAKEAIVLSLQWLDCAVNTPNEEAREAIAKASNLAGKAINISKTTACHALSYPMTSFYGVPHGHAVALSASQMLQYNAQVSEDTCCDPRGAVYVKETMQQLITALGATNAQQAGQIIETLLKNVGLATTLSSAGVDEAGIELILSNTNVERMKNNPRVVESKDVLDILHAIK